MHADLYIDHIDVSKYLPMEDCLDCGFTCKQFAKRLIKREVDVNKCPHLSGKQRDYIKMVVDAENVLPKVPIYPSTITTKTGFVMAGNKSSPILVTANYPHTQAVIGEVLAKANIQCNLLIIDTEGYSVDMAVYLNLFTGERVRTAILESDLQNLVNHKKLVIPGLAERYKDEIEEATGWEVLVGPVCAVEIPIFLLSKKLVNS
ncbi:hypothetical protein DRP05_10455 [Archaeoglobales archaeon]|nr:MAG: hypothetical protein DRP05_10455 [Archaeoglobales archaeon]